MGPAPSVFLIMMKADNAANTITMIKLVYPHDLVSINRMPEQKDSLPNIKRPSANDIALDLIIEG